jgi:hydroxymethylpyrimidine pyrophosphatase-like HAD family hydrolase
MDLREVKRKAEIAYSAEDAALKSLLDISRETGAEVRDVLIQVIFETALHREIMRGIITAVELTEQAYGEYFKGSMSVENVKQELLRQDEIEKEAYELYLDMAKTEENTLLRNIFDAIARSEETHHALIRYINVKH